MKRADGWITIGTKVDNSQFDKDIAELQTKINQQEKKSELKYEAHITKKKELEELQQEILKVEAEFEKASQGVERFNELLGKKEKTSLSYTEFTELQGLQNAQGQFDTLGGQLDKMYIKQQNLKTQIESTGVAYQDSVNKVQELKNKADKISVKKANAELKEMKDNAKNVGKSFESFGKQVSRTVLAIFGIRTAITMLTRASAELKNYDKEYASNLEYIQYALTMMVAPALKYIVNLMGTILQYINAIVSAWFGLNLFKSANDFKDMKKSASSVARKC